MIVSHNLRSINANNKLAANVRAGSKSSEKLSSGLKINRAGDNASGLAVSEKLRSQTRGLKQATANANDAISLIQTAEGGLNETHAILQRMRELAVQSANGTYQDDTDREAMQLEIQNLKEEVDRISSSTEYNKIKLLDGSLDGATGGTTSYGAAYGERVQATAFGSAWINVSSNVAGVKINVTTGATVGGENAVVSAASGGSTGLEITLNLEQGKTYTDAEINDLIKSALQTKDQLYSTAQVTFKSDGGSVTVSSAGSTLGTVAGVRSAGGTSLTAAVSGKAPSGSASGFVGYSDAIRLTANSYGSVTDNSNLIGKLNIIIDAAAGKESVLVSVAFQKGVGGNTGTAAEVNLHLSTGVEYTEEDIQNILAKAGYDYTVELKDLVGNDSNKNGKIIFTEKTAAGQVAAKIDFENPSTSSSSGFLDTIAGAGVGKEFSGGGEGLVFQIGANGTADQRTGLNIKNMSTSGLGLSNLDVSTRKSANEGIAKIDEAIKSVSLQRADLGAKQNRLEYTINNLTTTNENLTAAEAQIRDTNMAEEMIEFTRASILQQASQAMLAQANQAPQAVLQLLG